MQLDIATVTAIRQQWNEAQLAHAHAAECDARVNAAIMQALVAAGASLSNDRACLDCGAVLDKRVQDCPECAREKVQP